MVEVHEAGGKYYFQHARMDPNIAVSSTQGLLMIFSGFSSPKTRPLRLATADSS